MCTEDIQITLVFLYFLKKCNNFDVLSQKIYVCSSAQQAQNNAAAAAVHAAIHLKEIPEESVRHDEFAINHNYGSGPSPYGQSQPSPSPTTGTGSTSGSTAAHNEYEFAGYK